MFRCQYCRWEQEVTSSHCYWSMWMERKEEGERERFEGEESKGIEVIHTLTFTHLHTLTHSHATHTLTYIQTRASESVIKSLLKKKANLSLFDSNGNTPLHLACLMPYVKAAQVLCVCVSVCVFVGGWLWLSVSECELKTVIRQD